MEDHDTDLFPCTSSQDMQKTQSRQVQPLES